MRYTQLTEVTPREFSGATPEDYATTLKPGMARRLAAPLIAGVWLLAVLASAADFTALKPAPVAGGALSGTNIDNTLPQRMMAALDEKEKLGVGDRIIFRVLEDQEEPKVLTITDSGQIDVPELGLVTALGKTCKQLAFEIQSNLVQTTYYRATVVIGVDLLNKTVSGRRVYVAGQVRRSGPQQIPAGETWTLSKAILAAGGFTDYADKKRVRLVRGGSGATSDKGVVVNVAEIWEKGRTELDLPVESEDLIYVPERAVNF